MDSRNYTAEAQGVIQQAFLIAGSYNHRAVETGHLFKALLDANASVTKVLFGRLERNPADFDYMTEQALLEYPKTLGEELYFSLEANRALTMASEFASEISDGIISVEHILVGIASVDAHDGTLLHNMDISPDKLKALIREHFMGGSHMTVSNSVPDEDILMTFTTNLNLKSRYGRLGPVMQRDEEINQMMQILSRRTKHNVLLIGDPGVGKTSVVEGLVAMIVQDRVPEDFRKKQIIALNLDRIDAYGEQGNDVRYGVQKLLKRLMQDGDSVLMFIDDVHDLIESERKHMVEAAGIIRSFILSDEIQVIVATTLDRYYRRNEQDRTFVNRFQPMMISEPGVNDARSMLLALKPGFEQFYKVNITDEAIFSAVNWSARYISNLCLPYKAVEIIDEASSRVHLDMVSVPEVISELEKQIATYEVKRNIAVEDEVQTVADDLGRKIHALNKEEFTLKARLHLERSMYEEVHHLKQQLNKLRARAELARKRKNYDLASRLHRTKITENRQKLDQLYEKLVEIQQDSPLINANVTADTVAEIVSKKVAIPTETLLRDENEMILHLEEELKKYVFGQPEAIKTVAEVIRRRKAGIMEEGKPVVSFMFAGAVGSGKTEMAGALSRLLCGSEKMLVQIRMNEYRESRSLVRLIGSIGDGSPYEEKGRLLDAVRRMPYAVVLLKSIEMAHPDIITFLIQLLKLGYAIDPLGRKISFLNTIIIMTTLPGKEAIFEQLRGADEVERIAHFEKTSKRVYDMVKTRLPAALMNLLEELIVFVPLHTSELLQVIRSHLNGVKDTLAGQNMNLRIHDRVTEWLAELSTQQHEGVHSVKKLIQKRLLNRLSEEILAGRVNKENVIWIDVGSEGISIRNKSKEQ